MSLVSPAPPILLPRRTLIVAAGAALAGCASVPRRPVLDAADCWHEVRLPGKLPTLYALADKQGRRAIAARADRSASMWRKRLPSVPAGEAAFSWWVDRLIPGADLAQADRSDAPARVLFGFGGDVRKLSARTRMMYELAQALTGEEPPYATLMYVWANEAPVGSMIVNPRIDRVRKIVLDSGADRLRSWRDHRRSLADDFKQAFGEAPGPLTSVALMTDADNTRSSAHTWYGPVTLT